MARFFMRVFLLGSMKVVERFLKISLDKPDENNIES